MLDICSAYGEKRDVCFNPMKSQLMTFGGTNPDNMTIYLDRKIVQWCTKVKYLGLYLIGGANFKIDLTVAKRKYHGSFNNIRSVVGRQVNEIMVLHLLKSYCLPRLIGTRQRLRISELPETVTVAGSTIATTDKLKSLGCGSGQFSDV